jgi:hypothetical protein
MRPGYLPPCTHEPPLKPLPAPTPQEQAESDQDGHPARVKAKMGGGRADDKMGAFLITLNHRVVLKCR